MNQKSKFLLINIFSAFFILLIYCEYVIYYVVIKDCSWPSLDVQNEDLTIKTTDVEPVRIMVITDIHLLGPRDGYWFDKFVREWQMYRAFQTSVHMLQPELVFVLGDIMDEGFYCSLQDFDKYVHRFKQLFAVPKHTKMYTVVGNHDIGFHNEIKSSRNQMFIAAFNSTPVQFFSLRGNYFVLINSMALEGDGCTLCKSVELQLSEIENKLKCSKNSTFVNCTSKPSLEFYSKPILMQHYPLYRSSDKDCDDFDSAPMPVKEEIFKEARECLSKNSTYQILNQIKPRLALSGHTHHGCTRKLPFGFGEEITISSFNRRNKNNPTIGLGVITPNNLAFIKCPLPQESTIIIIYISGMTVVFCWILYSLFIKRYISSLKYIYRVNYC